MTDAQGVRLPLSAAQSGVWFAHQLDPTGCRFNIGEYLVIHGPLDPVLFDAAARQVAGEVEALRVRFGADNGRPWQLVAPICDWSVTFHDVTSEACPEEAALAWMRADVARPVDLLQGPLVSWALFKVTRNRFLWCHRYHHIVMDGFSGSLVVRRMAEVYTALASGLVPLENGLGPLCLLLEDDAAYRASQQFADDRDYWVNRFSDPLESPRLGHRPGRAHGGVLRETGYLSPAGMEGLRSAARRARTTWPVLMIAVTATYLHRMTGLRDVVVGLPVSGRTNSITRRIPGMAANVLPIRIEVRADRTSDELVRDASKIVRQALRHQRYGHEDLLRELRVSGNERVLMCPKINIMSFEYDVRFAGNLVTAHGLSNGPVDDIAIFVYDRLDHRSVRVDFAANSELYNPDELARHHRRFTRLLEAVVADPDLPIGRIDILAAEERHRLLVDYNDTAVPVPPAGLVVLFETQAHARPEAVAVVCGDSTLTYTQLNAKANQLAHELIARGVGAEQIVALALPRSPELVVAILAVHKAGAAYLPVDPDYPPARIGFMLGDARPVLLLTTTQTVAAMPEDAVTLQLRIDAPDTIKELSERPDTDPTDTDRTTPLTPQHPAYVIYTSGSTGRPKGVVVCHRGISSLAATQIERLGLGPASRVLQFASPSFDASIMELLMAFAAGGALVISPVGPLAGEVLAGVVADQGVSHALIPPAALVGAASAALSGLQTLIVGGEACPADLVAIWSPGRCMINACGPTETTVCATMSGPLSAATQMPPPIGRPIFNTRVYVLDKGLQLVAPGVPGELYIGGAGLARGYLHQPGLTAQRFVADPYGPAGTRLYRTGDLVRWRADGNLEFVGRADDQVKIRGFRIEPGEIEAVLAERDEVACSAVVACEDGPGGKRLVGYLVPAAATDRIDTVELRRELARTLPDYLVPSALVVVPRLPLTPSGKVDRRQLALRPVQRAVTTARTAPRGELEQRIAGLWSQVLDVEQVGADDNFFDLGGHSLLLATLQSGLTALMGRPVPIVDLFTHTTVAAQARHLGRTAAASPELSAARERVERRQLSRSRRPATRTRKDTPPS